MKIKDLQRYLYELNQRKRLLLNTRDRELCISTGERQRYFDEKAYNPLMLDKKIQEVNKEIKSLEELIENTEVRYRKNEKIGLI